MARKLSALCASLAFVLGFSLPAWADHWYTNGWRDKHWGYPTKPNGFDAIKATFGEPCSDDTRFNTDTWQAYEKVVVEGIDPGIDPGGLSGGSTESGGKTEKTVMTTYALYFHKKLGGMGVPGWSEDKGGTSTLVDNDIHGHIWNAHREQELKPGLWGWACRPNKNNVSKVSTHAWGIAFDVNAAYEHLGHCHNHTVTVDDVFTSHNFQWLTCDAMHFQYADGY